MNNKVAVQQKVIITRVGAFWVDLERAQNIDRIRQEDPNAIIDIDGNMVSANQIYATLTPEQYSNYQNEKRGMWQCAYQKWHPKFDNCEHAREQRPEPKPDKPEMSDADREKARAKLDEIRKNISKNGIKGLKK